MGKHPSQEKKAVAVYLLTKTDKPIQEITRDTGMNKVEHVVREKLNSCAVEGSDRTAKPVFDKEMARKNQVEMLNDRQVEQEMMGVGRQLSRPEFQFVIDN